MASKERDLLIAIGADPHQKDGPVLPLDLATIQRLLEEGVNPDRCRDRSGTSALGVAAYLGRTQAMMLLLEYGADVDAENLDGASPLSMAVFGKSPAAVALLLACEADAEAARSDAQSLNERDCIKIFECWAYERPHELLVKACEHAETINVKRDARAAQKALLEEEVKKARTSQSIEERALAAEARADLAEARVAELEVQLALMEERALAAEAAAAAQNKSSVITSLLSSLGGFDWFGSSEQPSRLSSAQQHRLTQSRPSQLDNSANRSGATRNTSAGRLPPASAILVDAASPPIATSTASPEMPPSASAHQSPTVVANLSFSTQLFSPVHGAQHDATPPPQTAQEKLAAHNENVRKQREQQQDSARKGTPRKAPRNAAGSPLPAAQYGAGSSLPAGSGETDKNDSGLSPSKSMHGDDWFLPGVATRKAATLGPPQAMPAPSTTPRAQLSAAALTTSFSAALSASIASALASSKSSASVATPPIASASVAPPPSPPPPSPRRKRCLRPPRRRELICRQRLTFGRARPSGDSTGDSCIFLQVILIGRRNQTELCPFLNGESL
jgi:hypothetical protein